MICLVCRQVELVDGFTSVTFECGEMRLIVKRVPARICPGCGEVYVDEQVAARLLRDAEAMSTVGELESEFEYS